MFWLLEEKETLHHKPKLKQNTQSHQYFYYQDLKNKYELSSYKGKYTSSGVFVYDDFRDNLIIDKYHPTLQSMRTMKTKHLSSENSEDAITWNVFKSLQQIHPRYWYQELLSIGLNLSSDNILLNNNQKDNIPEKVVIKLWQSIKPPASIKKTEGQTEVDVVIESEEFVWFIEAKYKSDISIGTTHDKGRNQILRNIDVGSRYAGEKNFYFSLLILEDNKSSKGIKLIEEYKRELAKNPRYFQNLVSLGNNIVNLKDISVFRWNDLGNILESCMKHAEDDFEQLVAERAYGWLMSKYKQ